MNCPKAAPAYIFFCLILLASCSSGSSGLVGTSNGLVEAMRSDNLVVKEGFMANVDIIALCCDPSKQMPMCYGNNPGAPYMTTYVPEGEGQTVVNSAINYYSFPPAPTSVNSANRSRSYRLGANEALVIVGKTPPSNSIYYSYNVYVGLRCVTGNCFAGAIPDFANDYKRRFATMVDALSNVNIWTSGTPGGAKGDSFNKDMMIIVTSDRSIDRRIRAAAQQAGYSSQIINTIVLPVEFARLGLEYGKDEFAFLHRLAERDESFINNPPLRLFRVASAASPLDPFPTPALTTHGGKNIPERVTYGNAVEALKNAILNKYRGQGYTDNEYRTDRWVSYGRDSLVLDVDGVFNGYDDLADNSDAIYLRIPDLAGGLPADRGNTFSLDNSPDDFVIVYGVNHTKTGFTTYSSISTYKYAMQNGGASKWIDPEGTSAVAYLRGTAYENQAPYLYVMRVARSCSGISEELCLELPDCVGCPDNCKTECRTTGADDLFLGLRGYVEPATGTGPSYDEIIWDKAIHFKK